MASGIKPVYVFDGKAPQMKGGELAKRTAKRAKAMADLETAKASENMDDMDKFNRRLVKVTRQVSPPRILCSGENNNHNYFPD